jgi:hypothetical protein
MADRGAKRRIGAQKRPVRRQNRDRIGQRVERI